jgi:hypothetical protein
MTNLVHHFVKYWSLKDVRSGSEMYTKALLRRTQRFHVGNAKHWAEHFALSSMIFT